MKKNIFIALSIFFVFAVLILFASSLNKNNSNKDKSIKTVDLGSITLETLSGKTVKLSDYNDTPMLVHFWNTWCVPCQEELPEIKKFLNNDNSEKIKFVAIVRDDSKEAVKKWIKKNKLNWIILLDPQNKAAVEFGTTGQPETYSVTKTGLIAAQQLGGSYENDFIELKDCAIGSKKSPCKRK